MKRLYWRIVTKTANSWHEIFSVLQILENDVIRVVDDIPPPSDIIISSRACSGSISPAVTDGWIEKSKLSSIEVTAITPVNEREIKRRFTLSIKNSWAKRLSGRSICIMHWRYNWFMVTWFYLFLSCPTVGKLSELPASYQEAYRPE